MNRNTYEKKEKLIQELQERLEYYEIHDGIMKANEGTKTYSEKEMREKLNL